jgi:2'-5' RNA ligase
MAEEKKLTRAFICIEFNDEVIKEIARVQELIGKVKFTGKLTELENLHLTLKFLGEIDDKKFEMVKNNLKSIKFDAMKLKLGKIGTFSFRGNLRIVWIKVEGKAIYDLQTKIDEVLIGSFKPEERFMGHLTIARIKYVKDKKGFLEHVNKIKVKPVSFACNDFKLKKSELRAVGPVYSDIESYKSK